MRRINAGLDAPGEPLTGSWEDPNCELRGHYLGHWLSGTATLVKYTGKLTAEVIDSSVQVYSSSSCKGYAIDLTSLFPDLWHSSILASNKQPAALQAMYRLIRDC